MKKLAILLFLCFPIFLPNLVRAVTSEDYDVFNNKTVTLAPDQIVNRDYFAAGETIDIAGTINGDAYVAGGQIIISGTINGDLIVAGGQIEINGTVKQNVRGAGGQITVNGTVGRNLSLAGGSIDINSGSNIGGNVVVGAGNLVLAAPIKGDLRLGVGNVTLSSQVTGNALAGFGHMLITSTGSIKGDLVYWSDKQANLDLSPDATVGGQIAFRATPSGFEQWRSEAFQQNLKQSIDRGISIVHLLSLLGSIIVAFIMIHFFPNYSVKTIKTIETNGWSAAFTGLAALILTPFVAVFLFVSLIGIPLALLLMAFYVIGLYVATLVFMYWLGARFIVRLGRQADKTITFLVGAGLYYILTSILIIRPFVTFFAIILGLGALLLSDRDLYLRLRRSRTV